MALLSAEALKKLICSQCEKYLSVLPVKVYPDTKVRCGRCTKNNDGGTNSQLFEMVAKKFRFPCINRFNGCKETLNVSNIKEHESSYCNRIKVMCPMSSCTNAAFFVMSTYDLLRHFEASHKEVALDKPAFWINLDEWVREEIYFYCKDNVFVNVGYKYTAANQQLILYFKTYGIDLTHNFKLYFVQNEVPYETGIINSIESDLTVDRGVKIDLTKHSYPKNVIFCKFKIWENNLNDPSLSILPVVDGAAQKAAMKFTFNKIIHLKENVLYFSSFKYWVGNKLWQLVVKKHNDGTDPPHLAVYLSQLTKITQGVCNIAANVTLLSSKNEDLNVVRNMGKRKFRIMGGWRKFLNWHSLIDSRSGYVNSDSIQFDVTIEVLPSDEDEVSTDDTDDCPNCD